ncbi:MAG: hypothetical protein AB7E95_11815, partial [Kiritimatiellales bacterium]
GPTPLVICILMDSGEKVFVKADRHNQITVTTELIQALEKIAGEGCVYIEVRPQSAPEPRRRFNRKRG